MKTNIILKDGRVLDTSQPLIMGIINATPDSFYTSSSEPETNIDLAQDMINQGADILDIGAMSSRPGAEMISAETEWERLKPVLQGIRKLNSEIVISVDTVHCQVARQAVDEGADIINDISFGDLDHEMAAYIKEADVPYIGMHMLGNPSTMQSKADYADVVEDVYTYLEKKSNLFGLKEGKLILDIGIGFGKSIDDNYRLVANLDKYTELGYPLLLGISRKSLLYSFLGTSPHDVLSASSAMHLYALEHGADILRVHDVHEAVEVSKLWVKLRESK